MYSFLHWLTETQFADLRPKTGQWQKIPTSLLTKAQHEPSPNIDTELFDLLSASYAYIGGYPDFQKASDIPANHTVWYGLDVDGDKDPDAIKFGKDTSHGLKWTGFASDGSVAAKRAFLDNFQKLLWTPGNYCEVSFALMHVLLTRYHVPYVHTQEEVERVLGKPVTWYGRNPDNKYPGYDGFYTRDLFGQRHTKIMLGQPK
jgi:hypothetical protein